ncbi:MULTISPECIES: hypothetical protein [unclassified Chryseobacterium]|uniref:hypothetical protein n=1 Tax=unclassified Chryseobacterium TaxID=2593645 RepID=UPI000D36E8FE|nr:MULTISPECIES: hypothetical protein [unclassified Chryseobacterium]MCQ4141143.1 hypothetical protein [Chryseobacterium sp. EO14]PTT70337.1 hypothetical protein DBR25_18410 [Chryseobacterium sp. HMWF001]PVV56188.1 hypothetical protein DD829_11545 [Chryseobacterium sp. HMWF035]
MKKLFTAFFTAYVFTSVLHGQVGINTTSPDASLDIRAKNHSGSSPGAVTSGDGVLVPRVNALSVNGSVNGQLVYLIADAGGFLKGFHYWNGTAWTALDATNDAWTNDSAGTMIKIGTKSDGSARSSNTDFVATDAGRVGIGTNDPKVTVQIEGQAASSAVPDGFTPPRLTRAQLSAKDASYGNNQNGTLVFVTTLDGSAINKVSNVTSVGLYFYDAPTSRWYNIRNSSSGVVEGFKIITGTYSPTTPYVVQPDDYILILRYSTASTGGNASANVSTTSPYLNNAANLQLPDPTTCPGRVLHFINDSDKVGSSTAENVYTNYAMHSALTDTNSFSSRSALSNYEISTGQNNSQWKIISDGTRWISLQVVIV